MLLITNLVLCFQTNDMLINVFFLFITKNASKNYSCFKNGEKRFKYNHPSLLVLIRETICCNTFLHKYDKEGISNFVSVQPHKLISKIKRQIETDLRPIQHYFYRNLALKKSSDIRFQRAFTACYCVFKVISLA